MSKVEVVHVTPELAKQWLAERSPDSRDIRADHVARLAADMTAGRWAHSGNGEAIKIERGGRLLDGQHRLWACVVSGLPFESHVVSDIAPNAHSHTDYGPLNREESARLLQTLTELGCL